MNKITTRVAFVLLLCALFAVPSVAKVRSRIITIGQDFTVGGTAVKAGTYRFSFDDKTNELSISDRKTKQVLAKATARTEERRGSQLRLDIQMTDGGGTPALMSVAFPDEKRTFVVSGSTEAQ